MTIYLPNQMCVRLPRGQNCANGGFYPSKDGLRAMRKRP